MRTDVHASFFTLWETSLPCSQIFRLERSAHRPLSTVLAGDYVNCEILASQLHVEMCGLQAAGHLSAPKDDKPWVFPAAVTRPCFPHPVLSVGQ